MPLKVKIYDGVVSYRPYFSFFTNRLLTASPEVLQFSWHEGLDFPQLGSLKLGNNPGLQIASEWGDVFLMQQLAALDVDSDVTVPKGWQDRLEKIRAQQEEADRKEQDRLEKIRAEQEQAKKAACLTRGKLFSHRYHDNCDGTVTDATTNLMWKRCIEGQTWTGSTCAREASYISWNAAMPDEQQKSWASFAGYSDWRMPSKEELLSLVYCSSGKPKIWNDTGDSCEGEYQKPTIDQTAFPSTPDTWFWTASPVADDYSSDSWIVVFSGGFVFGRSDDGGPGHRDDGGPVRLVRGAR